MIEVERSRIFSGITVCLRGSPAAADVRELPELIAHHCRNDQAQRILFDWSALENWSLCIDTQAVQKWLEVGRLIERAAIVHHHRWNRQAAWLGAALRLSGSQVRSYRLMSVDNALIWLGTPASPGQFRQPMER